MKPAVGMVWAVIPKYHTDSKMRFLCFEGHSDKLYSVLILKEIKDIYLLDDWRENIPLCVIES